MRHTPEQNNPIQWGRFKDQNEAYAKCVDLLELATKAGPTVILPETWWKQAYKAVQEVKKAKSLLTTPKPPADPRHKEFIAWWVKRYQEVYGREYVINGMKDGANLSRFLKSVPTTTVQEMSEMVEAAWNRALRPKDSFHCRKATTITGFVTSWNDICAELERGLSPVRQEGGGF
jgi:hypothetical protein